MRPFTAVYDGECPTCLDDIEAGVSEIVKEDGEWVHAECADTLDDWEGDSFTEGL